MNKIILIILYSILIIGCSSENNRPAPVNEKSHLNKEIQTNDTAKSTPQLATTIKTSTPPTTVRETLLEHYNEWRGVNYKYGGLSKRGIDCSGFVYLTYRDLFETNLPRSTKLLASTGEQINQKQLRPGDLVLYKTTRTVRHAGIYIGDNKFLHASKSKGVMISDMDLDYWKDRYWQARRVL